MNTLKLLGSAAVAALALTACSGTGQDEPASGEELDLTIAVVTHGKPDDAFWSVVKAGADRAGEDLGVEVEYDSSGEVASQAEFVDQAVAEEVDGLVVSLANPDGMRESVTAAVEAGIPVVTINSGVEEFKDLGAITHVGQSETIAGQAAGAELAEQGATTMLCVIHEAGNIGLEQRCDGAEQGFDGEVKRLQIDTTDAADAAEDIAAALQADDSIDAVLTLNGGVALGSVQAVDQVGSEVAIGTFDLSADVIAAIQDESIAFAVDQQPYVQGYLGVQFLYLKALNGNDVGGGQPVNSGPTLVTQENADQVAQFAEQGTR